MISRSSRRPRRRPLIRPAVAWSGLALGLVIVAGSGCHSAGNGGFAQTSSTVPMEPIAAQPGEGARAAAAPSGAATSERSVGRVEPARSGIRSFSPAERVTEIDTATVSLRRVFEDLGPEAALWYQHVQTLASPYFEGRAPGTDGIEHAADYIEFFFRRAGLEPAFVEGESDESGALTSYRQPFDFRAPRPTVEFIDSSLQVDDRVLVHGDDYVVLGNSAVGTVTAPVTFVGYGIESGPSDYTSFDEETDLTGRIALLLRYEPLDAEGKSRWAPRNFSRHASIARKMRRLVEDRSAAGILMVNPPGAVDGNADLESLATSNRFGRQLEVPVIQISAETAAALLAAGDHEGRDMLTLRTLADDGAVKTVDLDDALEVTMSADLEVEARLYTANVGAVLPGRGALADEWIVIGAHYDHVGYGYTGTRPGNVGKLHPGADDNASGTSGLLMAASRLTEAYDGAGEGADLRSIMFIAFSAEEAGLHGSRHFVEHPSIPLDRVSLMVNFDMIGRLRSDQIRIQGTGTAAEFETMLTRHFERSGLTIVAAPGGRGPSDHSVFYGKDVPVLFAFTGTHEDYHAPTDFGYTVNPAGAMRVLDLFEPLVMEVATRPDQLTFAQSDTGGGTRRTGARVRLGIVPSYTEQVESGVLVDDVAEGTSAAVAGIVAGDIIVSWNGEAIEGGRRLFELLMEGEPGDQVQIGVLRDDEEHTLLVVLQPREEQEG